MLRPPIGRNFFKNINIFSEEDWLKMLDAISPELDVDGVMELEPELVKFVKDKKRKTAHQDRLYLPDLLECLEPVIRDLYQQRLDNQKEEFDCEFATSMVDQMFYMDYFVTTAMMKTYLKAHPTAILGECLIDLFSLGGSSETYDLFPEIVVICHSCSDGLGELSDEDICSLNKMVLKKQIEHKFMDPKHWDKSDRTSLSNKSSEVFVESKELSDLTIFNPFAQRKGEQSEEDCSIFNPFIAGNEIEVSDEKRDFVCDICGKSFSESEFINMHNKLFHHIKKNDNVLKLRFIDNGENLMNSFIIEEKRIQKECRRKEGTQNHQNVKRDQEIKKQQEIKNHMKSKKQEIKKHQEITQQQQQEIKQQQQIKKQQGPKRSLRQKEIKQNVTSKRETNKETKKNRKRLFM